MKRILAYVPDEQHRELERIFGEHEVRFEYAPHGAEVLQRAITRNYDAVLLWDQVPVLDQSSLLQLLRNNPKLQKRPIFVIDRATTSPRVGRSGEISLPAAMGKEFTVRVLKELQLRVEFDPEQTFGLGTSYEQIPLLDFLNIIEQNAKSGRLNIESPTVSGLIYFRAGTPIRAELDNGLVFGAKAFCRLIISPNARIHFKETAFLPVDENIQATMQQLILEAFRIQDESTYLLDQLGDLRKYEVAIPSPDQLAGLTDEQRNLLLLAQYHEDISRALDFSVLDDAAILHNLKVLVERGIVVARMSSLSDLSADETRIRGLLRAMKEPRAALLLTASTPDFVGNTMRFFERLGVLDGQASLYVPDRTTGVALVLRDERRELTLVFGTNHDLLRRTVGPRLPILARVDRPERNASGLTYQVALLTGGKRYLTMDWSAADPAPFWRRLLDTL